MIRWWMIAIVAGCSGEDVLVDEGPPPALSGPLLGLDVAEATAANTAALPAGFTMPQETVCAADVTRGFLVELQSHGLDDAQVNYEWAPIVPGSGAGLPTIAQPEFSVAGTVKALQRSGLDFRPAHPFGFDTTWDLSADEPFRGLVHNRPGDPNDGDAIHAEIESGLYPDAAFGLAPTAGDRVILKGAWIYDCGHPPYETEIHPMTFAAFARVDGAATVSLAFANPFRITQLYGDVGVATSFADTTRYGADQTKPFPTRFGADVIRAAFRNIETFELHPLVDALRFGTLTWFVCAPGDRPSPSATVRYSYRFVARSGVTVSVARRGDSGCLAFHATMDAAYQPMVPARMDYPWPWAQMSSEATSQIGTPIDVRQLISDELTGRGFSADVPALAEDNPPVIDVYPALAPRAMAAADSPTAIVMSADDQPFPFYGRVRVSWQP